MATTKLVVELSDNDLLSLLKNHEDNFTELKTGGDHRDWLKTVVAFANTAPIGFPAVLFIGVRDDGTPEGGLDLDKLQKTFNDKMSVAYPPIYYLAKKLSKDGKHFLAIIVPGSANRPHFSGPSYVRRGSHTFVASEEDYTQLIAARGDKARELLAWKGKLISVDHMRTEHIHTMGSVAGRAEWTLVDCNSFFATFKNPTDSFNLSVPLKRVELSYDNGKARLKIELYPI